MNQLQEVYESLDGPNDYDNYDVQSAKLKHRADQASAIIEKQIRGVISYYKQTKAAAENNPSDMTALEDLEKLQKFITKNLAQFSQF